MEKLDAAAPPAGWRQNLMYLVIGLAALAAQGAPIVALVILERHRSGDFVSGLRALTGMVLFYIGVIYTVYCLAQWRWTVQRAMLALMLLAGSLALMVPRG